MMKKTQCTICLAISGRTELKKRVEIVHEGKHVIIVVLHLYANMIWNDIKIVYNALLFAEFWKKN